VPAYLTVTILALAATDWFSTSLFKRFYISQTTEDLKARAEIIKPLAFGYLIVDDPAMLDSTFIRLGRTSKTRFTVIALDGRVLGDTDDDPAKMENHADRPEFKDARQNGMGVASRFSPTLKKKMIYVAIPLGDQDGEFRGVIRASVPLTAVRSVIQHTRLIIAIAGMIIILLATLLSYIISRRISKPLEQIKRGAERFAAGELNLRLTAPEFEEFEGLADALNQTATQLSDRIGTISRQRNELEAVLGSMVEGILAVDMDARLIRTNRSAAAMLGFNL